MKKFEKTHKKSETACVVFLESACGKVGLEMHEEVPIIFREKNVQNLPKFATLDDLKRVNLAGLIS